MTWLWIIGYLAIGVLPAAAAMRAAADSDTVNGYCHGGRDDSPYRVNCRKFHGSKCWRSDNMVDWTAMFAGSLVGLLWPLALMPAAAVWVATRKPTPGALQDRIAELEKEIGLGDH